MMKNFIFKIFIFIIFLAQFSLSKSKELYDNDELLPIFVKDPANFKQHCKTEGDNDCQYLIHRYEDHIGYLFWYRKYWHCDKIEDQFKEVYERTECHKYRKYLDILYEYLFREYAGLPAVKPMFYVDKTFSFCKLTGTIILLGTIWNFYFDSKIGQKRGYKLGNLFMTEFEPMLFNEEKLYYKEPRETFQEIVVQMGLQLKWDNEIRKINSKLFQRQTFDELLEEMWERYKIRRRARAQSANDYKTKKYDPVLFQMDFDDGIRYRLYWYVFVAFVRGPLYFEQICNGLDEDNFLLNVGIPGGDTLAANKEYLAQKYDTYLGIAYLMKKNWHCAKMVEKSEEEQKQKEECEKFGKYLDIYYEYLFNIYAKTEMPSLSSQFPTFAPFFNRMHLYVIFVLHKISKIFFDIERTEENDRNQIENKEYLKLNLLNENKMRNYKANFGNLTETLRQKFNDKLKTMLKSAREAEKKSTTNGAKYALMELRDSPFYDTVSKTGNTVFIAFVRGQSIFEQFCLKNKDQLLEESHKALPIETSLEQRKEHLTQKYEAHLGLVYLMRKNWKCDKIGKHTDCQKYRKYLDTFYAYLFNLQNEDDDPLKAINSLLLIRKIELFGTLIDVVKGFSSISTKYFESKHIASEKFKRLLRKQSIASMKKLKKIFHSEKGVEAITEGIHEEQFDEKIKEFCKKAEEIVQKDEETMKKGEQRSAEFDDKFGTLFDSPFYGRIAQCCKTE